MSFLVVRHLRDSLDAPPTYGGSPNLGTDHNRSSREFSGKRIVSPYIEPGNAVSRIQRCIGKAERQVTLR